MRAVFRVSSVGLIALAALAGCSSSSSTQVADGGDGIDIVPGQCVLAADDVWHCGDGFDIAQCPGGANGAHDGMTCAYVGSCFECAYASAGAVCSCVADAGPRLWSCLPSGTACGP